ncbi:MAG: hypothetical protein JJU45_09570 [Acidimicrobiia bacterium]|nr:hypothetical protein [Acidimicrobiia bacterium]
MRSDDQYPNHGSGAEPPDGQSHVWREGGGPMPGAARQRRFGWGRAYHLLPEDGSAPDRPPLQGVAALGLGIAVLCVLILIFVAT